MITTEIQDKDFLALVRMKYNNINSRVRHRKSYIEKNIQNRFTFHQFLAFAHLNGLEHGKHCHRPNKYQDYCPENLVFITPEEHNRISGLERRKLSEDQIAEIKELSRNMSLRNIAKIYGVSHVTIHRYLKMENENGSKTKG